MNTLYKRYYDIGKVTIWADSEGTNDQNAKRPRMVLSFRDGNPRFNVYTGETGPNGIIFFPMDVYTFGAVIETLKLVIDSEPGTKLSIDSLGSVWENDKPTNKTRVVSVLYIGKTKDGVIYLSVIDETKPKIVFPLKSTKFHNFYDTNKEKRNDGEISKLLARGLVTTFTQMVSNVIAAYVEQEYKYGQYKPGVIKGFEDVGNETSTTKKPKKELTEVDSEISAMLDDLDL